LGGEEAEELDPTQYFENRVRYVNRRKAAGDNPYPHKFQVSVSLLDFVAKFSSLEAGTIAGETVSIAGEQLLGCSVKSKSVLLAQLCHAKAGYRAMTGQTPSPPSCVMPQGGRDDLDWGGLTGCLMAQLNMCMVSLLLDTGGLLLPYCVRHSQLARLKQPCPWRAGRIHSKRASGAKLMFYDLHSEGAKVQIMADAR
jgi:lysyl-tRNA synthetase class II